MDVETFSRFQQRIAHFEDMPEYEVGQDTQQPFWIEHKGDKIEQKFYIAFFMKKN